MKWTFGVKLAKTRTRPISSHFDQTSFGNKRLITWISAVVPSRQDGAILPSWVQHFMKYLSLMRQSVQAGVGKRSRQSAESSENDKGGWKICWHLCGRNPEYFRDISLQACRVLHGEVCSSTFLLRGNYAKTEWTSFINARRRIVFVLRYFCMLFHFFSPAGFVLSDSP